MPRGDGTRSAAFTPLQPTKRQAGRKISCASCPSAAKRCRCQKCFPSPACRRFCRRKTTAARGGSTRAGCKCSPRQCRRVKRDLTNRRGKRTGGVMDAGAPRACGPDASDRPSAARVDPSSIDHQISSRAIGKRPSDSAVHHHRRSGIHHDLIGGEAAGRIGDKMRTANRDHTIGRSGRCARGHPGRSIKSFLGGRGAPVAAGGVPGIAARLPTPRLLSAPGFFASQKRTVRGEARKAPPGSLPGFKKP